MNPKVIQVRPGRDYVLDVLFADGERRRFDMKPYLEHEVFRALKDGDVFKSVRLFFGGVAWSNNADLSADTLYFG